MIINDQYHVAFVQIPKCAGTSIRRQLADYDASSGKLSGGLFFFDDVGQVDTTHIPLSILKKHFSEAFKKVVTDESCVIRQNSCRLRPQPEEQA